MRLLIILFLSSLSFSAINAQKGDGVFKAIGQNKLHKLETLLANTVDFCVDDDQKVLSKSALIKNLRQFLKKNKVQSARQVHFGDSSANGSYFRVGKLKTQNGSYRLFLYFENKEIVEMRIDGY